MVTHLVIPRRSLRRRVAALRENARSGPERRSSYSVSIPEMLRLVPRRGVSS